MSLVYLSAKLKMFEANQVLMTLQQSIHIYVERQVKLRVIRTKWKLMLHFFVVARALEWL